MVNGSSIKKSGVKNMRVNSKSKMQNARLRSFKNCNSQEGMVLIISLLLLLVATVVGVTALSTSTTNVMITGNQRLNEITFSGADSGISASIPVINTTAYNRTVISTYTSLVVNQTDFVDEITGTLIMDTDSATTSPDITFTMGSGSSAITVSVDVDYLYSATSAGCAIEFASGYEGVGKGAISCGEIYYEIASMGEGPVGSEAAVCSIYRYVIH
jgi:Tfp pilus assembly protein PilX